MSGRGKKRSLCREGCGRTTQAAEGVCEPCQLELPVPMPAPRRLPEEYLLRCAEELAVRAKRIREEAEAKARRLEDALRSRAEVVELNREKGR